MGVTATTRGPRREEKRKKWNPTAYSDPTHSWIKVWRLTPNPDDCHHRLQSPDQTRKCLTPASRNGSPLENKLTFSKHHHTTWVANAAHLAKRAPAVRCVANMVQCMCPCRQIEQEDDVDGELCLQRQEIVDQPVILVQRGLLLSVENLDQKNALVALYLGQKSGTECNQNTRTVKESVNTRDEHSVAFPHTALHCDPSRSTLHCTAFFCTSHCSAL